MQKVARPIVNLHDEIPKHARRHVDAGSAASDSLDKPSINNQIGKNTVDNLAVSQILCNFAIKMVFTIVN
jgi:hypothetical protein